MDPALDDIVQANARLLRYGHDDEQARLAREELNAACERALQSLVPAAGGAAPALASGQGERTAKDVGAFLRYLLRNIDLRERLDMLDAATETRQFLRQGGMWRDTDDSQHTTFVATHLAAALAHLGKRHAQ